jgi:hypothetical protein
MRAIWTTDADSLYFLLDENVDSFFLQLTSGNIVLVTGKDDVVSDGLNTIIVSNGHPLLGKITGVYSPRIRRLII